ncbi:DUF3304 domain-containing protein [Halopseudomonas sp.]|uniref:DUF3304 domain-containing protein n=1 Tax=Halopseudomonas sp. TaxID=2901191 RepID=UPI0030033A19
MRLFNHLQPNRLVVFVVLLGALCLLNACSAQTSPAKVKSLGAPIEGYNHSGTTAINRFSVNGNGGSNVSVSSGGGQTCCVSMPLTWHPGLTLVVEWEADPDPLAYISWKEPRSSDAWSKRLADHRTRYTHHRVEVEVAPYEALGVVSVHFLPCNEIKVTAGVYAPGHPQYPYNYPGNMEEPSQCPSK